MRIAERARPGRGFYLDAAVSASFAINDMTGAPGFLVSMANEAARPSS
jgi:hypothetical protein